MNYGQSTTPSTGLESDFSRMSFDHDFPDAPRVVSFEKENGANADDETSSKDFSTKKQQTAPSLAELYGSSTSGERFLQSPEPIRIPQAHHPSPTAAAEPYLLVTPDNHPHHVLYVDAEDENDEASDDSLDVSMILDDYPHKELTSNCFLPEVERSDCKNPVALTLWHNNNNNSPYGGSRIMVKEDWHYLNRVDAVNYEAAPAPIARRPPLPNIISRPEPIRPTITTGTAPPLLFAMVTTTCCSSGEQSH